MVSPSKVENVHENMYVSQFQILNQNDRWKFSPLKTRPLGSSPSDEARYHRRPFLKVKVKIKFILEQATKAQRGVEVELYSFFNLSARWGEWSTPRLGQFTPWKDQVPIVLKAGWAPGPVWTGVENLALHRDSIP